jgi:hypothetical protein
MAAMISTSAVVAPLAAAWLCWAIEAPNSLKYISRKPSFFAVIDSINSSGERSACTMLSAV